MAARALDPEIMVFDSKTMERVGLVAAVGLTRFMSSFLHGVEATDPLTFGVVAALLTAVALVASYLPALRASRTDPLAALRFE